MPTIPDSWTDLLRSDFSKLSEVVGTPSEAVPKLREGERRRVTTLFLDIKGFTAMSERLDPEEVQLIIDNSFKIFTQVIEKYGGYVDRYEGDCIIALFGSRKASEADAERAVRSGLEMQSRLVQINEILSERGLSLQMRIGINTGLVVTGRIGSDRDEDFTVMGDAVNVAARLESAASVGTVLISRETKEEAGDAILYNPQGQISVKGKMEPVEAFVATAVNPTTRVRWERTPLVAGTGFIGREKELALLADALDEASMESEERPPVMVAITGPAGIGKSRLVHEFLVRSGLWGTAAHVAGRTTRFASSAFQLFTSIPKERWGLENPDSPEAVSRLTDGLKKQAAFLDEASGDALLRSEPLLCYAFGVHTDDLRVRNLDPQSLSIEIRLALKNLLASFVAKAERDALQPILVLEDLQWLDSASEQALPFILGGLASHRPPLVLLIQRSDKLLPSNLSEIGPLRTVVVPPFDDTSVDALACALLDGLLPAPARRLILERGAGNPFFIEEILRVLVARETLQKRENKWHWHEETATAAIPSTVAGIIQSGIDSLLPDAKAVLERAAVVGTQFDTDVLVRVSRMMNESPERVERGLRILHEEGFVIPQDKPEFYLFRCLLTQEVAYGTLLHANKRVLHRLVAEAIEESNPDPSDQAALLTHHYLRTDDAEKALHYLLIALAGAIQNYHNDAALELSNEGLLLLDRHEQLEGNGEARFELLRCREEVENIRADREAQRATLEEMTRIAAKSAIPERIARADVQTAMFAHRTGDFETAKSRGEHGLEVAEAAGLKRLVAMAHSALGISYGFTGDLETGRHHLTDALSAAQEADDRQTAARVYNHLGILAASWGNHEEAYRHFLSSLETYRVLGDRLGEGNILTNLLVCRHLGDYKTARAHGRQALAVHRELGNTLPEAITLSNLGTMAGDLGEYERARAYNEEALAGFERADDKTNIARCHLNLAVSAVHIGDRNAADRHSELAIEMLQKLGSRPLLVSAYIARADYLGMQAEAKYDEAIHILEKASSTAHEIKHTSLHVYAQVKLSKINRLRSKLSTARDCIAPIVEQLDREPETFPDKEKALFEAYQVFKALDEKERGREYLKRAKEELLDNVAIITDRETREARLFQVTEHREILDAADAEGIEAM
jgi:class 3 adenylate cyclase/predicted ATPase